MEFGKKKVGKVGTSKFLNILLPHKYVGAVLQDHCLICNFIPKTLVMSMGAGTPTPRASAS